ncbi:hypothetical protein E3P89_02919 [Wallemia ichthyophaga]|uniref:C2 domain-containing protein n=1 Tax=Wallemia ichthyophaga TaxID=245174 RepID=A0A4T0H0Y4_WALIC|nr:hypothetical protein E3P90_03531 [Wallemia ichthyophaga]TIB10196.1 hypothetical protein E3P93_02944 [Wallemia ichthyophaga]TIB20906.1 hypothetical protein E3P89_02919 [Wallemia ichthyophaga]TIB21357.1 hypothetical protein E3P88_03545 [Wallemia ichthyophaga]
MSIIDKGKGADRDSVYNHALRVAYLSHLTSPKPSQPSQTAAFTSPHKQTSSKHLASISSISISDVLKDSLTRDSKGVKFPEKFVKALEKKCEQVAMGRDPIYNDRDFRAIIGVFYGKFSRNKQTYKSNRKIEEIVMHFVSEAVVHLKKISPDNWQNLIILQSVKFIQLISNTLKSISGVSTELLDRIKGYEAKLNPGHDISTRDVTREGTRDAMKDTPNKQPGSPIPSTPNPGISHLVSDMPMVLTVGELYGKSPLTLQEDVNVISLIVSEKAALNDIKTCLQHLGSDEAITGKVSDFASEQAYDHWKLIEMETLTQLMKMMVQLNPALAKSGPSDTLPSPRPAFQQSNSNSQEDYFNTLSRNTHASISRKPSMTSRFSLSSVADAVSRTTSNEDEKSGENANYHQAIQPHNYTIIPPSPRSYYASLLNQSMAFDLDAMQNMSEDDQVSLGIISSRHLELLAECAVRWRISPPSKTAAFVNEMVMRFETDQVPIDCIHEAIRGVQKTLGEWQLDQWPTIDRNSLISLYKRVAYTSLIRIGERLDDALSSSADDLYTDTEILPILHDTGLLMQGGMDIQFELDRIKGRVSEFAKNTYNAERKTVENTNRLSVMDSAFALVEWVQKTGKKLDKLYPMPLLDYIDIVPLFIEKAVPLCIADIKWKIPMFLEQLRSRPNGFPIDDAFELMSRRVLGEGGVILRYSTYISSRAQLDFSISTAFGPFVEHYLEQSGRKTEQWVQAAIRADNFQQEDNIGHSSSIVDLFASLKTCVLNIKNLDWPDQVEHAKYMTRQAKTLSRAIDQYSRTLLDMFMNEMFPAPLPETPLPGQSAWVARAQHFVQGEKKTVPFNFDAKSCVKLNNIESAKSLLDSLYTLCDADEVANMLQEGEGEGESKAVYSNTPSTSTHNPRYLFSIKVVMAEDLRARDLSPGRLDPFVTIADERGDRIYKSRTIYNARNPRWEESVDLSLTKALWIGATLWDRSTIGEHKLIGRGYLKLDPPKYEDCLPQDKWLKLDSNNGAVLLRVSMEGEKDDIQFHFGRANISLKRAESDMCRTIVDKMSPFIQQCLNRTVLRSLRKGGGYSEQVTKTIDNITANYKNWKTQRTNQSMDSEIPLPKDELPPTPPTAAVMRNRNRTDQLTDEEIEDAIGPLFDYFDANFAVLASTLTDTAKITVMSRVWKEVLMTIEGLLVPPLSEHFSDMRPLPDKEVDIVFKWLQSLRLFFYADGEGLPLETLQNQKYNEIVSIRLYYDWPTDPLMEECVKMMQMGLRKAPTLRKKRKTVKSHRNMGTIKARKKKDHKLQESDHGDIILKILRMRPSTKDFVGQQLEVSSNYKPAKNRLTDGITQIKKGIDSAALRTKRSSVVSTMSNSPNTDASYGNTSTTGNTTNSSI